MSGDFAKLHPEVKDLIWGFVVVPEDVSVTFALDEAGRMVVQRSSNPSHQAADRIDTTNFSLLFTDRQTSEEARRVFYNTAHTNFAPEEDHLDTLDKDYSAAPVRFFHRVASHDLATIRTVQFAADNLLKTWLDGGTHIVHVLRSPWASICDTLAYKCPQLQPSDLCVAYNSHDAATFAHRRGGKTALLKGDKPPAWAYLFGKIRGPHHLQVEVWLAILHSKSNDSSTQVEDAKNHILKSVMQMRSDMLDYATTMSSVTNIGVTSQDSDVGIRTKLGLILPGYDSDGTPLQSIYILSIGLSIDKHGKTSVKSTKRVKVRPDRWCESCGAFEGLGYDDSCWSCGFGGALHRKWYESDAKGRPWAVDRWPSGQIGDLVQNFLPPDVSIEDFETAQSYLEAGHEISLYAIASRLGS